MSSLLVSVRVLGVRGGYQTVHAFDVTASQGAVFIRDKRKLVVVLEQDVQPGSAARYLYIAVA